MKQCKNTFQMLVQFWYLWQALGGNVYVAMTTERSKSKVSAKKQTKQGKTSGSVVPPERLWSRRLPSRRSGTLRRSLADDLRTGSPSPRPRWAPPRCTLRRAAPLWAGTPSSPASASPLSGQPAPPSWWPVRARSTWRSAGRVWYRLKCEATCLLCTPGVMSECVCDVHAVVWVHVCMS